MTSNGEISVGPAGLCAESFGDAGDPATLLIHGAAQSLVAWPVGFCERLAAGGRLVIRYDARDAGRSSASPAGAPTHDVDDEIADAVAVLDAYDVEAAQIVGMSGGAAVAQLVTLDHPERVSSLVLTGSTPGIPGSGSPELPGPTDEIAATFGDPAAEPDWGDRDAAIAYLVEAERPYVARFDEAEMRAYAELSFDRATDLAAQMTNPFLVDSGESWRGRLGEIRAPTLVIHGAQDPVFPPAHGEALAREIPGAELLLLDGVSHEIFPPYTWDVVVPRMLEVGRPLG